MRPRRSAVPLVYAAFVVIPLFWMAVLSVRPSGTGMTSFSGYALALTSANYAYILSEPDWIRGYLNALIYVLMNVAITVLVAVPAAFAFSRYRFPGSRALFFGLLVFRMMAPAILLVPLTQIFADLGLTDTHFGVALAHCFFNVPIAIWILEGFISAIPREVDETARIDGMGFPAFFGRVLLPLIAPGIAVTAFFCFMFSWVETLIANGLTVVDAKPINGILSRISSPVAAEMPLLAAAGTSGLIPGVLLVVFMRRHLARGFSMGRVV
ncbi:MAG: carbohydrate ABC transporter permease [Paracoccaceae bacterium]